jgi:hypothetical protein
MKKVFICGNQMSGKNILRKLLDGHPNIICNHIHDRVATSLLGKGPKSYILKGWSKNRKSFVGSARYIEVCYGPDLTGRLDFSDLLYLLYCFSDYRFLHRCANLGLVYFKAKEGVLEAVPFKFSIADFEQRLYEHFLNEGQSASIERLVDWIYEAYAETLVDLESIVNASSDEPLFVDTLSNGTQPVLEALGTLSDAKFLIMDREISGLLFANAVRIFDQQEAGGVNKYLFSKILFSQTGYVERLTEFKKTIVSLSEKSDNIMVVSFERMIFETRDLLEDIRAFLEIPTDEILYRPTIFGKSIESESGQILGRINDDPRDNLSKEDMTTLESYSRHLGSGEKRKTVIPIRAQIGMKKIYWSALEKLGRRV